MGRQRFEVGAFDELLRMSMDTSDRRTRLFSEAKHKGNRRSYFLQLAGRLLGSEMMILGLKLVTTVVTNIIY